MLWFLPIMVLPLLSAPASAQRARAPLVVSGLGNATAKLDGTWQFHLGDDTAWAAPGLDDSAWEGIAADKSWGRQGHAGYTGYAWYRRHIEFAPVAGAKPELALFMPQIDDAYEVYWNGARVGSVGNGPPNPVWYFFKMPHTFGLGTERQGVLAVRVWKAPYNSFDNGQLGGFVSAPMAGSPEAVGGLYAAYSYNWLRNHQYTFGLNFLYALIALLGFLAWMRDRGQKVILWVTLFAASPVLGFVLVGLRVPFSNNFALGMLQPVFSLQDISLWFLLLYLLKLEGNPRLWRWTRILAVISIVATTLDGSLSFFDWSGSYSHFFQLSDAGLTAIFTLVEAFPLVLIPFAFGKRLDVERWLVAGFAFLTAMIQAVRIASQQGSRYTHWTIADKISAPLFTVRGNPFSLQTITSTLLIVSIVYAVYRYSVEQGQRQGALEQEFKSAQELQRVLIPETLPSLPGFSVTSAYIPAQEVGGDFFQVIERPDGSALIVIGDVSGKGLKAAMAVALIVGAVRTLAESFDAPAAILARLNRRLNGRLQHGFATCLVLRLSPEGECVMATAAHPPPFLNEFELSLPGALPLGLVPDVAFEEVTIQLNVGDRLMLYTDGLLEARNALGDLYSFDRLQQLVATQPDAQQAGEAAVAFGQEDDITVLTIARLAIGAESTTSLVAPRLVPASA